MKRAAARVDGNIRIVLKSGKDQSLHRLHPWVFSGAIKKVYGEPADGDVVDVYDNKDSFMGTGHFQPGSIAVRILSFTQRDIDAGFFREKIQAAVDYRRALGLAGNASTNVFRLIHGEGDQLPGLIADYYNGVVVVQYHSVGMYRERELITSLLASVPTIPVRAVYEKSESTLPFMAGLNPVNGYVFGSAESGYVVENGFKFNVDWVGGQKTGFFIDQRENRLLASTLSEGRSVLNLFGYTGGFSVYTMKNARLVHTVDSSAAATALATSNIALNYDDPSAHESITTDAFNYLDTIKGKYDMIILDPPAFAKHNNVLGNALQGYKRLNIKAIENINPGGIIMTFSCSQVVTRENFRKSVFAAAANTRRNVRIIHQLNQPADHPVNIYHPESEYLKGLVLFVE